MAYIPPEDFSSSTTTPTECPHCGYNLHGLPENVACPECGKQTSLSRRKYTPDIPLSQMPESFVKRIAICFVTTVIVIPFFLAREFVPLFQFQNKHTAFVFDFSLALIWVVGVLLLTTPLNCPEAKRYGLAVNGILRRIARWCSVGVIGIVISEYVVFTPLYVLAGIVFIVGVVCLLLLLANIADWVRDESAKKWLEYAAWGAPFFFVVSQVLHLQQISPVINYGAKLLMYIFIVGGIFGLFMLTSSVVQAITHARNYREYQKRRLKSKDSTQFPYPK